MRIVVDPDLCAGHGECEEIAPEVFEVREDGIAHLLIEQPGAELAEKVEQAILWCPANAISLVD